MEDKKYLPPKFSECLRELAAALGADDQSAAATYFERKLYDYQ